MNEEKSTSKLYSAVASAAFLFQRTRPYPRCSLHLLLMVSYTASKMHVSQGTSSVKYQVRAVTNSVRMQTGISLLVTLVPGRYELLYLRAVPDYLLPE